MRFFLRLLVKINATTKKNSHTSAVASFAAAPPCMILFGISSGEIYVCSRSRSSVTLFFAVVFGKKHFGNYSLVLLHAVLSAALQDSNINKTHTRQSRLEPLLPVVLAPTPGCL